MILTYQTLFINIEMNQDHPTTNKMLREDQTLPWWVELLFVQVGLPDRWLRGCLKTRKRTLSIFKSNKGKIKYSVLALLGIIYINPIIKQAKNHNLCIKHGTNNIIAQNSNVSSSVNKHALSYRYCNGGELIYPSNIE